MPQQSRRPSDRDAYAVAAAPRPPGPPAARRIVEAREAVRELMSVAGSSVFSESHPLQCIWRDTETANSHAVSNPSISAEVYGRLLLGYDGPTAIPV